MRFLLDTDTCIWILRKNAEVQEHLKNLMPADVAVSAMNEAELLYGALNSQYPLKRAKDVAMFLAPILVLPFDAEAAKEHARLRQALKSAPIGERDLVIASVAIANRLTVVTHNQREFGRVPGLKTVDWFANAQALAPRRKPKA